MLSRLMYKIHALLKFDIGNFWHWQRFTLATFDTGNIWYWQHFTLLTVWNLKLATFEFVDIWQCWHLALFTFTSSSHPLGRNSYMEVSPGMHSSKWSPECGECCWFEHLRLRVNCSQVPGNVSLWNLSLVWETIIDYWPSGKVFNPSLHCRCHSCTTVLNNVTENLTRTKIDSWYQSIYANLAEVPKSTIGFHEETRYSQVVDPGKCICSSYRMDFIFNATVFGVKKPAENSVAKEKSLQSQLPCAILHCLKIIALGFISTTWKEIYLWHN